jgi:hypothetical protein
VRYYRPRSTKISAVQKEWRPSTSPDHQEPRVGAWCAMQAGELAWQRVLLQHSSPKSPEWLSGEHLACPTTSNSQSPYHIHRMLFSLAAGCPEVEASVVLADFCTTSTRWYVLVMECQVGFCVPPFEDGIPAGLSGYPTAWLDQYLFCQTRACTRCTQCSSTVLLHPRLHSPPGAA